MADAPETTDDQPQSTPTPGLAIRAWTAPARAAASALKIAAAINILYLGAHILLDVFTGSKSAPPQAVMLGLLLFSALPWILALGLRRLAAATLTAGAARIIITARRARFEIPIASVKDIEPWILPLPEPALALRMASGSRFRVAIAADDPDALLDALPAARALHDRPATTWARALHLRRAARRWWFMALKFGLFPLLLTVVVFRLHQMIVYGGPFGEAQMYGYARYLRSFALFWSWNAAELVIYAASIRVIVEVLILALTRALPARAGGIRRGLDIAAEVLYFALIPLYVAARLLA